uniref:NBS-LRR disease resistance-like protein n=1 Tax=Populus alba TaxID=43335 RepID=A0A4U5NRA9_POPAL|nr:NBS-LRR disease resistance-like protein [Populus alba]
MDVVGGVVDMINLLWIRFGRQINDVRKLRKKLQKLKADAEDLSNRKSGLTEELRNNVGKMASKRLGKRVVQANFRVRELMRTKLLGYIGDGGVLSKHGSVCSAQKDMAGRLKVVLGSGESEERTSRTIFQYLHSKKSLLLLDDVWDDIDLDHVGIPNPKKQGKVSKVVLATSLPEAPYCAVLSALLLQSNGDLEIISDMFFQYITGLGVLNLSNNGISLLPPSIGNLINLRGLYLNQCSELAMLPSDVEGKELEEDIFPNLEDLRLYDLPRLSNIVEGHVSPRSLANLKFLSQEKRDNMRHIFSWSMIEQLPKLETLYQ